MLSTIVFRHLIFFPEAGGAPDPEWSDTKPGSDAYSQGDRAEETQSAGFWSLRHSL